MTKERRDGGTHEVERIHEKLEERLKILRDREPYRAMHEKLKSLSPNFLWDRAMRKIVIIDSQ